VTTGLRGCHSWPQRVQMSGIGNRTFFVMPQSYSYVWVGVN
jgi:hypothetical protein